MNGAGAGENVTTEKGVFMLNEIYPYKSSLVKFAIKNPTYYVPSMSVTYSYWSASKKTSLEGVAKPKDPPGVTVPQGYTSLFMGSKFFTVRERDIEVEETYLIGKINKEVYEDSSK